MQRDVRAIKHKEKFGFVLMDSFESLIECCKACFSGKDRVETQLELNLPRLTGSLFISFEISIKIPDLGTCLFQCLTLLVSKTNQLVDGALSVNPAQSMYPDVELTRIVTDDDKLSIEPVIENTAKESTFRS